MRYPASEKLEIIRLVEQSHLPARKTLEKRGVPRATFYRWCDLHQTGGLEALEDKSSKPSRMAALERQLKKGDKSLVGNKGYRLATPDDNHFVVDAKFDGIFVLRTNADLAPLDAMLCYKRLWMVERAFRTSKSLFATRPIFHKLDETIRGHVSCSFLALVLKKELEDRIATLGQANSWPDILADLDSLTETEVEQDGKRFLLRTPPRPAASLALRAAGVALPPTVRQIADA